MPATRCYSTGGEVQTLYVRWKSLKGLQWFIFQCTFNPPWQTASVWPLQLPLSWPPRPSVIPAPMVAHSCFVCSSQHQGLPLLSVQHTGELSAQPLENVSGSKDQVHLVSDSPRAQPSASHFSEMRTLKEVGLALGLSGSCTAATL